jgi:hypothetical protein
LLGEDSQSFELPIVHSTINVASGREGRTCVRRRRRCEVRHHRPRALRHSEDGFDVDGELTLHGVTRPFTLALDVNGFTRDRYGGTRGGFSATTELNRGDFGISTNIPMDGGGVVIGDRIQVFLEIEAVLNPPQQANP